MFIIDSKEKRRLAAARVQPRLPYNEQIFHNLLDSIVAEHFPKYTDIPFYFVVRGPLACICMGENKSIIYVHEVLNHPETPIEVMSFIFKHELLHLMIPSRVIDGKNVNHPPDFWEKEKDIAPERSYAWDWIWRNYCWCLKRRPKLERIDVESSWKEIWHFPKKVIGKWERKKYEYF